MKIEKQVCAFEQAKKLKELGVLQESFFVYRHWRGNGKIVLSRKKDQYNDYPKHRRQVAPCVLGCAFTCAELGAMLPDNVSIERRFGTQGIALDTNGEYWIAEDEGTTAIQKTMASTLALCLIEMLNTNEITIDEVNERVLKNII